MEKALPTTRCVELVGKKEFVAIAFDPKYEIFIVYIAFLSSISLNLYLFYKPQIADLIAKKASMKISAKYTDFADVFSPGLVSKLSKYTEIKNYAIKLVNGQ